MGIQASKLGAQGSISIGDELSQIQFSISHPFKIHIKMDCNGARLATVKDVTIVKCIGTI